MFRYVIYGVATACLTFVYSLRLAFNTTVLCQYDPSSNGTEHYLANPTSKVLSYSATSIGLFIGLPPLFIFHKLGTRNTFFVYGLIGFASSFLYPLSDRLGFYPAFIIRLLQGLPGAIYLMAVNNISLQWAPKNETGLAIAILSCYYQLSPMIASITSGEMCTTVGWEWTYYSLATITAILFVVFWLIYSDDPLENRFVSKEEAVLITEGKSENLPVQRVPYSQLFKDPQVYLAWFLYFCFFVGLNLFLQFGPVYISLVLNFNIKSTGYATALPHLISLVSKFFYGKILDKCCGLSQRVRLIASYAAVELISAACLGTMIYASHVSLVLAVYIAFNLLHSLVIVVVMRQMQLIAKQHAHFLANGNTLIAAVCIFGTSFLQYFVVDNTKEQWTVIFLGLAGLLLLAVVLFTFFASSKPRKWVEMEVLPQK